MKVKETLRSCSKLSIPVGRKDPTLLKELLNSLLERSACVMLQTNTISI